MTDTKAHKSPHATPGSEADFLGKLVVMPLRGRNSPSSDYGGEFSELFREHRDKLTRFVIMRVGSRAEAEEIVQEAYLRLWQRERRNPDENLVGLLYVTARNLATDRLRQHRRRDHAGLPDWSGEHAIGPDQILAGRQQLARLQQLLEALPFKCRQAFIRFKFSGQSYAEIAATMHLTESMVRKYVSRAVAYCAEKLEQD